MVRGINRDFRPFLSSSRFGWPTFGRRRARDTSPKILNSCLPLPIFHDKVMPFFCGETHHDGDFIFHPPNSCSPEVVHHRRDTPPHPQWGRVEPIARMSVSLSLGDAHKCHWATDCLIFGLMRLNKYLKRVCNGLNAVVNDLRGCFISSGSF